MVMAGDRPSSARHGAWAGERALAAMVSVVLIAGAGVARAEERPTGLAGTLLSSRLTEGTWQIWQTDLATGTGSQLTSTPGDKRHPAFGPGARVAYCTSNQACFVMGDPGAGEGRPVLADLSPIRDLAWSPDGLRMVFARLSSELVDSTNLWLADALGSGRRLLTREPGIQQHPAWSPDGTRIAYVAGKAYRSTELYVINADGSERRRLTTNHAHEALPAWSPDGTRIAVASEMTGDYEIWLVNADGADPRQLTSAPGLDTHPAWSPDGRSIAFTTNRSGALEIWVMRADGSGQRPLEQAEGGGCDPSWR